MINQLVKFPVALVLVITLLMFAVDMIGLGFNYRFPGQTICSLGFLIFGVAVIAFGGYSFKKANTTVNPTKPESATRLVTTGVYRISRNPMYIGFLFWLLACAVYIGNFFNLLLLPVFIFLINRLYIRPEEYALQKLFGHEFTEYKKRVKRWL